MRLRDRSAIENRIEELEAADPEPNDDSWIPEMPIVENEAKVRVLYWALEEYDERRIYERWQKFQNTGATADRQGTKSLGQMSAKQEALEWVMGGDVEDPERFYDRLDEVSSEVFNLLETALQAAHAEDAAPEDTDIDVEPDASSDGNGDAETRNLREIEQVKDDVDVDPAYLYDKLDVARRLISEARLHMLNEDRTDDIETMEVVVGDFHTLSRIEDDDRLLAITYSIFGSKHFSLDYDDEETLERLLAIDRECGGVLRDSDRAEIEEALGADASA